MNCNLHRILPSVRKLCRACAGGIAALISALSAYGGVVPPVL